MEQEMKYNQESKIEDKKDPLEMLKIPEILEEIEIEELAVDGICGIY